MIKYQIFCPACQASTYVDKEARHYPCTKCGTVLYQVLRNTWEVYSEPDAPLLTFACPSCDCKHVVSAACNQVHCDCGRRILIMKNSKGEFTKSVALLEEEAYGNETEISCPECHKLRAAPVEGDQWSCSCGKGKLYRYSDGKWRKSPSPYVPSVFDIKLAAAPAFIQLNKEVNELMRKVQAPTDVTGRLDSLSLRVNCTSDEMRDMCPLGGPMARHERMLLARVIKYIQTGAFK